MISLRNVALQRGGRFLFEDATLTFFAGQKIGLTGANGSGKSSLFGLLLGSLHADRGDVEIPARLTIAHVAQETPALEQPALEFVREGDARLAEVERALRAAEADGDGARIAQLHHDFEAIDGWRASSRAGTILHGLGFASADEASAVREFSGGWRMRLNIARALMCPSDLLLLDEPTNHLDLDAVIWLEDWLRAYPGTLLLISHDRDFLDNVVGHVAHIERGRIDLYTGNYAQFERTRAAKLALQQALHERQQREVAHIESFIRRFKAKASKARQAQSRVKALERMELVAAAEADSPFSFRIPEPDKCPHPLLRLDEAAAGYGDRTVLSNVGLTLAPGQRLGLLGRNGAGKSTLVKLLAGLLQPRGGERIPAQHLAIGYFAQHQIDTLRAGDSPLAHLRRAEPATREQELREWLGGFGFTGDEALRDVATFSGGERTRLALALLVRTRPNLILLDEPTNHLDIRMRDALNNALQDFPGAVVLISHDRHLLRATCDEFLLVADGRVRPFDGDLDDYRALLMQPDRGDAPAATAPAGGGDRKEQKRIEAGRRNALYQKRKPLENRLKAIERRLDELHAEQRRVEALIADPGSYETASREALNAALATRGQVAQETETLESDWLALSEELAALK